MNVLAIDPGTVQSGFVVHDGRQPIDHGVMSNEDILDRLRSTLLLVDAVAIEWIQSYGMPVGADVFETCRWIGRFQQRALDADFTQITVDFITRSQVKVHLCNSARAKDSNIRQALIDLYARRFDLTESRQAIGLKADPGPLYGVKSHAWAALGVAETWLAQQVTA